MDSHGPIPLSQAAPPKPVDVPTEVDLLVREAIQRQASDIHLEPTAQNYELRFRIDGILQTQRSFSLDVGRGLVTRMMVMAQLLTYRINLPQEGRLTFALTGAPASDDRLMDMRLATMPTMHGLRAVLRLPAELGVVRDLDSLGLPDAVLEGLKEFARIDAGMLLLTGPAGSGKTTTIYALLEHVARSSPGTSVVALEDPIERGVAGITQIEVSSFGELTYAKALRSMLRQDPQVLMLGEIRDRETASIAVQAALSGHRLISTLHAGTPGGAVARLLEMGMEPYQLTSALFAIVSQRLVRRRVEGATDAVSYRGRLPIAEIARINPAARQAILSRDDAQSIQSALGQQPGYVTMSQQAARVVEAGLTDDAELARVGINVG